MKTFDTNSLKTNDPTNINWAISMSRFLLRDISDLSNVYPLISFDDDIYITFLNATSLNYNSTIYYNPGKAAAAIIRTEPKVFESFSTGNYSYKARNAEELANSIEKQFNETYKYLYSTKNSFILNVLFP